MHSGGDRRGSVCMVGATQSREQRSARIVRIACVVVPVMVMFVVAFMRGIGGHRFGLVWVPAVVVPAMAAFGWWGRGHGGGRLVATVTGALSELALGPCSAQEAHLSHGRLRAAMNSIRVPANFEHTGDIPGGSGMCFDEGPVLTRQWLVTGDEGRVRAQLRELLEGEGFVVGEWVTDRPALGTAAAEGRRGQVRVVLGIETDRAWRDGKPLTLAPGQVEVTVILETD
jgi:hypothetical protein